MWSIPTWVPAIAFTVFWVFAGGCFVWDRIRDRRF